MRVKLWAGAGLQPTGRLHPVLRPPIWLGKHRSGGILQLLCAACVCLPLNSYPTKRGGRNSWSQLVLYWSFASTETQVTGFAVFSEGKRWARKESLWCTSWLLETWRRLLIPSDISDSAWGNRSRQNSARHIGFVMMVTVQWGCCDGYPCGGTPSTVAARQKKPLWAPRVYGAAVCPLRGGAGKPQGACRELSKTASGKRASCFHPGRIPNPLLLLCTCLHLVKAQETYTPARGWTSVEGSRCSWPEESIVVTYPSPLLYFILWVCWGTEQNVC